MNTSTVTNRVHSVSDVTKNNVVTLAANDVTNAIDPLIAGLRARSRRAASELHRRFARSMLSVAKQRVQSDAEDIVQDAFIIALESPAESFPRDVAALETWLHGIVHRVVKTRRVCRAREVLVDAVTLLDDPRVDHDAPLHASDRAEDAR